MADPVIVVVEALKKFTERKVKEITLDVTANLIETTPRDTGWARANWIPKIGTSEDGTEGTQAQAQAGRVTSGKQNAGLASVATTYKLDRGEVFISNNVPYVNRLNAGSSRQAPAGFVQAAILRAIRRAS